MHASKSLCHGLTWAGHQVLTKPLYHSCPQLGRGEKKYHSKLVGQIGMGRDHSPITNTRKID